jgi:putative Mn2+ efflux pump MntP
MTLLTQLGIAVALAMDAFAVAIATGVSLKKVNRRQLFRLSWHFGLFQAMMPVIGWGLGTSIQHFVSTWAHWIAFGLLALVGSNMLKEAILADEDEEPEPKDSTKGMTLVVLSIATSIDALAVGFSMSMLQISIIYPALLIGFVAGGFTIIGMQLGVRIARLSQIATWAEILGGLVLWFIGLRILAENGVFT